MITKKSISSILLSACLLSLASTPLLACDKSNNAHKLKTIIDMAKDSKTNTVKVTKTTEESSTYIKDIFSKNNKTYVVVDFVIVREASDTDAGGITNNNPKLRTFELSKTSYWNCQQDKQLSVEAIWAQWQSATGKELIYKIASNNGKVSSLYLECAG